MMTECNAKPLTFHGPGRREIVAGFDGGPITSDAGGLLLREVERQTGIVHQLAGCFTDHRDPELIEHSVEELLKQRIFALCLGYEDVNDHEQLREDPLLATLVGKAEPTGQDRLYRRDQGKALAGKSTLNRLELTPAGAGSHSRYQKIVAHQWRIERLFVALFLQAHQEPPGEIILDLDATDDPLHGEQLGRFFHGYYKSYCYLPLYIFCGEHLLCAKLRPSNIDGSAGAVEELQRIVSQIRQAWPEVNILVRGDSGFCRERLMRWCEDNGIDYVLGLAKNARLKESLAEELQQAQEEFERTGQPARRFMDFEYQTRESWSRPRRVGAKAEHLAQGPNPRFVVTSLSAKTHPVQTLYEQTFCGRGDMENRIKEQQLYLFADRTSCRSLRANQLRLFFSSVAYVLLQTLRQEGLQGTELAGAQCETIRLKLLKIGARVQITSRKIWLHLASGYPWQRLFAQVVKNLRCCRFRPQLC